MRIHRIVLLIAVISASFLWPSSLRAAESENCQPDRLIGNCKQFSEKELSSIKTNNDPKLMMGIGIINLASNPTSRDLPPENSAISD
jgi:hypothetical protein